MKNALKLAVVLFAGMMLFAGCSGGSDSDITSTGANTISGLRFDLTGVTAIASVDNSGSGMRAVESGDGPIVGIEKGGTTKQIILSDYASQLPPVSQLIKQTGSDNKEYLYIVFSSDYPIWNGTDYEYFPQIICVSEDGSCANVMDDNYSLSYSYKNSVLQFDGYGNAYYCACGSDSSATVIFKYDPTNRKNTRLTAPVQSRSYNQVQVDSKGEWLFVSGYQNSGPFSRAIPVADPANFRNLNTIFNNSNDWISYEDNIYFINNNGTGCVQRLVKKDGTYSADNVETIFGKAPQQADEPSWDTYSLYSALNFRYEDRYSFLEFCTVYGHNKEFYLLDDNGNPSLSEIKNAFLWQLCDRDVFYENDSDDEEKLKTLAEKYDFRFDKFAEIKGLESLAEIAKGKKNEDAFEAILSSQTATKLLADLVRYQYSNNRYQYDSAIQSYRNNFLADITYLKNTKELLADTDNNCSCLEKIGGSKYYSESGCPNIFYQTNVPVAEWKSDYQNADGSVNAEKVLKGFFSLCNVQGDKEFRLDVFKNDDEYGELYSAATDEEAIKFISETPEKLDLFYQSIKESNDCCLDREKVAKICFIKGTDTPAYKKQTESSSSDSIYIDSLEIMNGGCLYGIGNQWYADNRELVLVKIINTNGQLVNEVQKINMGTSSNSYESKFYGNKFYFMTNNNGKGELYMINIDNGESTDILRQVPEAVNDNFQLISVEATASNVYFSAEYGLEVINRVYNTDTNKITNISSNSKFTNILSLIN